MALDPLTAGLEIAGKALDKMFPDPEARMNAQLKLVELEQAGELAQIAVNLEEAKSDKLFVAGWRPFVGWTCGVSFAYHAILQPLITYIFACFDKMIVLPVFDSSLLTTTLFGILGIGSLRTVEKMANKGHFPWQQ